jgi:hypothetical protein
MHNEKRPWGRRKSLIRPDSAKEIEGFYLDFLPVFLGFPSEEIWIPFRADLDFLHGRRLALAARRMKKGGPSGPPVARPRRPEPQAE